MCVVPMFLQAASRFSTRFGMRAPSGIWNGSELNVDIVSAFGRWVEVDAIAADTDGIVEDGGGGLAAHLCADVLFQNGEFGLDAVGFVDIGAFARPSSVPTRSVRTTRHALNGCYDRGMLPPVWKVLLRAALLARDSGASEIGIDSLLAAIDAAPVTAESTTPATHQVSIPIPHQDFLFTRAAAAAVNSAGGIETMSVERLRAALLAAKEQERR